MKPNLKEFRAHLKEAFLDATEIAHTSFFEDMIRLASEGLHVNVSIGNPETSRPRSLDGFKGAVYVYVVENCDYRVICKKTLKQIVDERLDLDLNGGEETNAEYAARYEHIANDFQKQAERLRKEAAKMMVKPEIHETHH